MTDFRMHPDFDPSRYILQSIAQMIDHPSLYMGGGSRDALRKAEQIWRFVCTDAIAIEARRAETPKSGSVEDESAAIAQNKSGDSLA